MDMDHMPHAYAPRPCPMHMHMPHAPHAPTHLLLLALIILALGLILPPLLPCKGQLLPRPRRHVLDRVLARLRVVVEHAPLLPQAIGLPEDLDRPPDHRMPHATRDRRLLHLRVHAHACT